MDDFPVVVSGGPGTRAVTDSGVCYYCERLAGERHAADCVVVCKRVRLRYTFEVEVAVPHSWDAHDIEFHRNDGSWCADNAIGELERQRTAADRGCLCGVFDCTYLGVADPTPVATEE